MIKIDLSIVIPVFNAESTLSRLLKSILVQNISKFEVIVVDDGSTDNTISVLNDFKNKFENLIVLQESNSGQAVARNYGLETAKGDWVLFLDSDDELRTGALSKMLHRTKKTKLVIGGIEKKFGTHTEHEVVSSLEKVRSNSELITNFLLKNEEMDVGLWNKLFMRKIIKVNNISFKNTNYFEDSFFVFEYLQLINFFEISYMHEIVYILYKRDGSTTRQLDKELHKKILNYIRAVDKKLTKNKVNIRLKTIDLIGLKLRLEIFEIHQHLKFDRNFDISEASNSLRWLVTDRQVFRKITKKYLLAYIGIAYFPFIYSFLYIRLKK